METIYNFRDFGGYKTRDGSVVKRGMLFRGACLAKASDKDCRKLSLLGIKTVCDLRTHRERADKPDCIPIDPDVKSVHVPIKVKNHHESGFLSQLLSLAFGRARRLNYAEALKETYQEYVTDFRPELSGIMRLVADSSNLPILIHCTGGKDRTGFVCAVIQSALGMPVELVIRDYLLTNDYLHEFRIQMLKRLSIFSLFGVSRRKFLPLFEARREYLEAAFDQIRNDYGTVEDYIQAGLGFSDDDKSRLSRVLLEKVDDC